MTIAEIEERGKQALARVPRKAFVAGTALVVAGAYGLGVMSGEHTSQTPIYTHTSNRAGERPVAQPAAAIAASPVASASQAPESAPSNPGKTGTATAATGKYVASKSGTRFYLPTCSGANRIKEENKIWFATEAEAEAAGFTPAAKCPGL